VAEPDFDFDFQKNESNDEKMTGLFKSFWPKSWSENNENGSKKIDYATGEYKNGLKSGFWKYKLCNGEVQYEGNYINGLKHGKWYNYDFCNNALEMGFLEMIYTTGDYYQLELLGRISKEEITFENGKPNDILYYLNSENNVILKINHKTGQIFYDNDQPLTNQTIKFEYPTFIGLENKELIIYHRNGTIAYKMTDIGTDKSEFFYSDSEFLLKKCVYSKVMGNCQTFSQSGMVIDSYQYEFGSDKFGDECPCQ